MYVVTAGNSKSSWLTNMTVVLTMAFAMHFFIQYQGGRTSPRELRNAL